ncbi:MAG: glycosyltransferase [Anaerolineae bacterium]|nr:glycosyltransferase [Anaerolineae bacterium]
MTVHQALHTFTPRDAISNQAAAIQRILRQLGFGDSAIFAVNADVRRVDHDEVLVRPIRQLKLRPQDWLILHFSIGSPHLEAVGLRHLGQLVFYYHNVTPPEYFVGYNLSMAHGLQRGRSSLPLFARAPRAWAASEFDLDELRQAGFADHGIVVPLVVEASKLIASAQSSAGQGVVRRYTDGRLNWLFVGRLVPNKRQDVLIRALAYYRRLIDSQARLLLVGSSAHTPGYALELRSLARALGVGSEVIFAGSPSLAEGFGGYFQAAHVFVCASAHEGFGLPLVEAMVFKLPIVACNTTGIPCAVQSAGILLDTCHPAAIAEAVHCLHRDQSIREHFAANQAIRLKQHSEAALLSAVEAEARRMGWTG